MTNPPPALPHSSSPQGRNGCLWGCLILLLICSLPPVLLGGYGAWFLMEGYRHTPVLRLAGELVREDGMERQVLGPGARVAGVEGNIFSWMPGGARDAYEVILEGPKGEGRLAIIARHAA